MARYSKSEFTNKAVIDAGKKLFYEKGYVATHCNDIAVEAGVNPGLIYYHFKTKGNVALNIYSEILTNLIKTVACLFPDENIEIQNAILVRIYWFMITHEDAYRRFIYEISLERIPPELAKGIGKDFFSELNKEYHLEQDENMLKLLCMCSFAIETELIMGYAEGYFNFSEEEMAVFDIKSMYELMSVPYQRINEILDRSKELFSQLNIKLLPEFAFDISLRQ